MNNSPATTNRVPRCFALRTQTAAHDAFISAPAQIDNGDEALYSDKSGTYTKGILQVDVGLVDLAAYQTFKKALNSGDPADFEAVMLGGTGTLNGQEGGLAFDLECLDSSQFPVPPAPALASEEYAAELVELYWASLLRDVAFIDYPNNQVAKDAATELSAMASYKGPRDPSNKVTPELLFRGDFAGEEIGPYISQFLLQPTMLGALPIVQKYITNQKAADFMLDSDEILKVQKGKSTGRKLTMGAPLYLHDESGLAAYTHVDVLYQAYFTAYLILDMIGKP